MLVVPEMSKPYTSKSVQHLGSYVYVKQACDYVLSYKYMQILYTYTFALINFVLDNVVVKSPFLLKLLTFFDLKADCLLSSVDGVAAKINDTNLAKTGKAIGQKSFDTATGLAGAVKTRGVGAYTSVESKVQPYVAPYQQKAASVVGAVQSCVVSAKTQGKEAASHVLKPVNEYASATVDKILPESKKAAKEAEAVAKDELAKSVEILSDTFERSRDLLTAKSSEVSNAVTSTYRKEFDTAEGNYYVKVASASVQTGVSLLKNANSEYLQPLKETSQKYAADTVTKAEAVAAQKVSEAKDAAQNANVQLNKASNGAIPIAT